MSDPRKTSGMSSSSAGVMKLLKSQKNLSLPVKEEIGELIYIPQKCYGVLTSDTPQHIKGLYTTGLNTCSGIVAVARSLDDKSIYFCHADTRTDLLDKEHGLLGWINKLPSNVAKIDLTYDDVEDGYYKEHINKLISTIAVSEAKRDIEPHIRKGNSIDMVLLKDGSTICGGGIIFDFLDKNYTTNDETMMAENVRNLTLHHEKEHSPICVFDGEKLLEKDEIFAKHPWLDKAIEDADATDLYADEYAEMDRLKAEFFPDNKNDESSQLSVGRKLT